MRHGQFLITTLLICSACATPIDSSADEAALREMVTAWDVAYNARDAEALVEYYAEDAVRMNANQPALMGIDAIKTSFVEEWEQSDWQGKDVVAAIHVTGDLATMRGTWSGTLRPSEGGEPIEDRGHWVASYRRQADGSWKAIWDIWTSELPPRP